MWSKAEPGKAGGRKAGSQSWHLRDDGGPPSSVHQCLFPAYYGSRTDAVDETGVLQSHGACVLVESQMLGV